VSGPGPAAAAALEAVLRRDRWIVAGGLAVAVAVSWAYLLAGAGMDMGAAAGGGGMAGAHAWDLGHAAIVAVMWWVMMAAMMLPSAAPMVLLFGAINRRRQELTAPWRATLAFALAYLVVWGGFSVIATLLQWRLADAGLLSPMMAGTSRALAAGLLLAAGLWQLTPAKHACLRHCRSPAHFIVARRREGTIGAFLMGLEHGAFCLGCCWVLMALLFVGGVMNLAWIGGLALWVLAEKTLPGGHRLGRIAGIALIGWGGAVAAGVL